MSRLRIGEALLSKGLVSPEQLQQALRDQAILGGHLGTCLIELGFLGEDELGTTLAELLNMRYATWNALANAPDDAIKTVSVELVERYNVMPIQLEDRSLHVATVAPCSLSSLSRATGKRIVPWIAPEIRILQAMQLHYGIPMHPRYIRIREQLDSSTAPNLPSEEPETTEEEAKPEDTWISSPDEAGPDAGAAFGYGRSWREIAEQQFEETPPTPPAAPQAATPLRPASAPTPPPGPAPPAFATSDLGGLRRETMRHVAGLLRIRLTVDTELTQLGFPVAKSTANDEFARWVAKASLDLKLDPEKPEHATDESGHTYRILRATRPPGDEGILETPLVPRVDFFLAVRLDAQLRIQGILRASYEAFAAAGTPRGGGVQIPWEELVAQGTGIEVLCSDNAAPAARTAAALT